LHTFLRVHALRQAIDRAAVHPVRIHRMVARWDPPQHGAGHGDRHGGGVVGNLAGQAARGVDQFALRVDRTHQAAAQRFLSVEDPAGHAPFERLVDADDLGQEPAGAGFRHDPAPRKDKAVARVVAGQTDIHWQLHGHAHANGHAVAGRNQRLGRFIQAQRQTPAAIAHARVGQVVHHLVAGKGSAARVGGKVGARAEGAFARAGEDHRADIVVSVDAVHRIAHLVHHRPGIGIQLFRPVERDRGDPLAHLKVDLRIAHGSLPEGSGAPGVWGAPVSCHLVWINAAPCGCRRRGARPRR
jgi:hypothetical protein